MLQDSTTFEKDETVFAITKDEESPKPPAEKITITVEADAGYTFKETTKPCTIEVEKNTTWTSLKPKTKEKIELLKDYEEAGWKLGGKDGGYIEDTYTFSANTIIYATSKKKGEPETPTVTITVNGDNGVEVVSPNNFKVDKGSKWESIKNQAIGKLKIKAHFEVIEWHLTKSTGTLITDQTEFKENGVVFAVSKEKAKAKYKVEHHQQNLLNGGYTKKETEEKEGFVGEETRAEAKKYPGFTANTFSQREIKANGKTIVLVSYKRNTVSLIIDLKGGKTTTELQNGADGKKLLSGKFEGEVSIKTPTKQGVQFKGWESDLPTHFPANDDRVYTAKWGAKTEYRVTITGDERVKVSEPGYIDVPIGSNKKIEDIKAEIIAKASLESGWSSDYYTFYDWRIGGEKGEEMLDSTQITDDIVVYARTNYKGFLVNGGELSGYSGEKPRGRIFFPKEAIFILISWAFKDCEDLTAVDFSPCTKLRNIGAEMFAGCSKLESVDLTGCTELTKIGYNAFKDCSKLESMNFSGCPKLTKIGLSAFNGCRKLKSVDLTGCVELTSLDLKRTGITSIDLSSCTKLKDIHFLWCESLESIDLSSCINLETIPDDAFHGCLKAEVKLPISITKILAEALGDEDETYCKKVLVPNEEIKNLVKGSGYPQGRIELYQ